MELYSTYIETDKFDEVVDFRSDCYHIDNFDIIKGKENMLHILENELSKKRLKGVVGIGAMSVHIIQWK